MTTPLNPRYAHVYRTNWWRLESGWIGFGERPFDDREIGLLWEIGQFEHKTVHLPNNCYRFEPNTDGTLRVTAAKGLDGQRWHSNCYIHESTDIEVLRAWVQKKARNMARGYRTEHDYHQGLKKAEADRRAKLAASVGDL